MATDTPVSRTAEWSQEVEHAAAEQGGVDSLWKTWELTRQIFPGCRVEIFVEDDPEIADLRYVVFDVTVNGWDASRLAVAQMQWIGAKVQCCPTPNHFVLRFRMDS